jgi:IS30 family transposase
VNHISVIRLEVMPVPGVRLSLLEREEISRGLRANESLREIARRIGRPASTVSREVRRNGDARFYRAVIAESTALYRARRPKPRKLKTCPALAELVEGRLRKKWSPEQIAAWLRREHPDDPSWWVSHETIYRSLYLQGRGGLRRELRKALRTGRAARRPQGRSDGRGTMLDMVMISERPAEVEDRAVPGHWEGDLLIGKAQHSQIATLIERSTRFVMLAALPGGRSAEHVRDRVAAKIQRLPQHLRRSLTWDQGKEMAEHVRFRVDTGVEVYFCDPHSPWQRGTNENTNGLLRQYFPKGKTDFGRLTEEELDAVAAELNERPRKTLGWMTPSEKFTELVATTG